MQYNKQVHLHYFACECQVVLAAFVENNILSVLNPLGME